MKQKDLDKIKQTLIYLAWGFVAMITLFVFMLIAALVGWGV